MPLIEVADGRGSNGNEEPKIDIIAVHGLNPLGKSDHATLTWTKKSVKGDRLWLRDDLPKDMPTARVFLYQYDSVPVLTTSKQRLVWEATELLQRLEVERDECQDRPLIFVAHSLGGILVRQALVNAHSNPQYNIIKKSTGGLAFFATPHGGGNDTLVSYGAKCAKIVNFVTNSRPNDLLKAVTAGSLYSDTLQEAWKHQLNDYSIYSFFEGIGEVVPRASAVLDMPGTVEAVVKINANHSDICRFDTSIPSDKSDYKSVLHGLRQLQRHSLLKAGLPTPPTDLPTGIAATTEPPRGDQDKLARGACFRQVSQGHERLSLVRRGTSGSDLDIAIPNLVFQIIIDRHPMSASALEHVVVPELPPYQSSLSRQDGILPTFIKSFVHYQYGVAYEEIKMNRHPNSCTWIFNTAEMKAWIGTQTSCALWLSGYPGIGKSTLASHLVDALGSSSISSNESNAKTSVIYSFCNHHNNNTASMVVSIAIHQILRAYPRLQSVAYQKDHLDCFNITGDRILKAKHRPVSKLWSLLCQLIIASELDRVFFVADAIDLLDETEQKALITLCGQSMNEIRLGKTAFKIFITSRPFAYISGMQSQWKLQRPETLQVIDAMHHDKEIQLDILRFAEDEKKKMQDVYGFADTHMSLIDDRLETIQPKRFLPVALFFKKLETARPETLNSIIRSLPDDLNDFNENFVSLIPEGLLTGSSPLMTCILHSYQALSISELAFACRWLEEGLDKESPFQVTEKSPITEIMLESVERRVKSYFPLFKIGSGNTVSVFHKSIRDFLLQAAEQAAEKREDFCLKPHRIAHRDLAILCMKAISHKATPQPRKSGKSGGTSDECRLEPREHTFLLYAVQFWRQHLLEAVPLNTPINEIDTDIFAAVQGIVHMWKGDTTSHSLRIAVVTHLGFPRAEKNLFQKLTPLEVLSAFGLDPLLRAYIKLSEVQFASGSWNPRRFAAKAVNLAIQGGHEGCFDILRHAFNISSLEGEEFKNVVADSAWAKKPQLVETVLRLRRTRIPEFLKALVASFFNGDSDSLDELVRDRSIFQDRDHFGMGLLHAIFAYNLVDNHVSHNIEGHLHVVLDICQYLIDHRVLASARDNFGFTALHWACRSKITCRRDVIEHLVRNGADPRAQSISGLTPLHLASFYSVNLDAVRCLLELGSNELVGISSYGRMTPLHWVVTRPQRAHQGPDHLGVDIIEGIMRLLLQHGADTRAANSRGITPLEWASQHLSVTLQAIYSGLEGVDIIEIQHNVGLGYFLLWEQWEGVDVDALSLVMNDMDEVPGFVEQALDGEHAMPSVSPGNLNALQLVKRAPREQRKIFVRLSSAKRRIQDALTKKWRRPDSS